MTSENIDERLFWEEVLAERDRYRAALQAIVTYYEDLAFPGPEAKIMVGMARAVLAPHLPGDIDGGQAFNPS